MAEDETRTRQVLIDPLLRKLGWDVSNPNIVQLEYRVKQGQPDYALMSRGKPRAVVEAKKLGTDLDEVITQAFNYANPAGIPYMIVTDGDNWEMYKVFEEATLEERLLVKLELSQQPADKNASQAWTMRKPNLTSKDPNFDPPKPALGEPISPPGTDPPKGCYSFAEQRYPKDTKPTALKIGNRPEEIVNFWTEVIRKVVSWLDEEKQLPNDFILASHLTTEQQFSRLKNLLEQLKEENKIDPSTIRVPHEPKPTRKTSR